ncbi:hypothetical protein Efla_007875 [Eimeria flavescens]
MLHQAVLANVAAETRAWAGGPSSAASHGASGGAGGGGAPLGASGVGGAGAPAAAAQPRDSLGRWRDVEMVPPPPELEELLVVLAAAVKVHVAELLSVAGQLEAREFEEGLVGRGGGAPGSLDSVEPGAETQGEGPTPLRILLPHHVLEAAKAMQPL